jgi:hypothetical protein
MAGEFSFSISLTLSLLYLGFLIRGLRTGKGRGITAVLLALCGPPSGRGSSCRIKAPALALPVLTLPPLGRFVMLLEFA